MIQSLRGRQRVYRSAQPRHSRDGNGRAATKLSRARETCASIERRRRRHVGFRCHSSADDVAEETHISRSLRCHARRATALALPQAEHARDADAPHRFGILGSIEVGAGGSMSDRVPRGQTLSLLALLLIHRGSVVHVDRALDELWEVRPSPGLREEGRPRGRVRLRSALGEARSCLAGGGYGCGRRPGARRRPVRASSSATARPELAAGEPVGGGGDAEAGAAVVAGPGARRRRRRPLRAPGDRPAGGTSTGVRERPDRRGPRLRPRRRCGR